MLECRFNKTTHHPKPEHPQQLLTRVGEGTIHARLLVAQPRVSAAEVAPLARGECFDRKRSLTTGTAESVVTGRDQEREPVCCTVNCRMGCGSRLRGLLRRLPVGSADLSSLRPLGSVGPCLLFIDHTIYTISSNEHFSPWSEHASTRTGTHHVALVTVGYLVASRALYTEYEVQDGRLRAANEASLQHMPDKLRVTAWKGTWIHLRIIVTAPPLPMRANKGAEKAEAINPEKDSEMHNVYDDEDPGAEYVEDESDCRQDEFHRENPVQHEVRTIPRKGSL